MKLPLVHIIYACLFALGVLVIWTAQAFPGAQSARDIGPAMFPVWLAGIMMTLIVVDLLISRKNARWVPLGDVGLAVVFAVAMASVVWASTRFGFFYVLPVALFIGVIAMGSRNWLANGLFSLLMPIVLWQLFDRLLGIPIAQL